MFQTPRRKIYIKETIITNKRGQTPVLFITNEEILKTQPTLKNKLKIPIKMYKYFAFGNNNFFLRIVLA